ncbi:hypothetical protein [Halocatena salina]|uniref:Peptidase C-terminal archaeal/bacterial domain-containing protein n=1 Tax=Halocatena salina TaxID=2934340 RepID=A0A8U0A5M2_9EURY|nr:hypothetical protein [Halocatena salina]UPM44362.1 hypothetical protein MW046_12990 [Halocatena salina]
MKRTVYLRVGVAVLVVLVAAGMVIPLGAVAQDQGEDEPNDAREAATAIKGTSVTGEITQQGDIDWFSKGFTKGETASFALTKSLREPGLKMTLYAPNGSEISNETGYDGIGKIEVSATASQTGNYFIKVEEINMDSYNTPYTIYSPAKKAPPKKQPTKPVTGTQQESEPNDERGKAQAISGEQISGKISSPDDTDWYSFQATEGENVSLVITKPDKSTSELFKFYLPDDDDFSHMETFKREDTRHQVVIPIERTGTHYIKITSKVVGEVAESGDKYTIQFTGDMPVQQSEPPATDGDVSPEATSSSESDGDTTTEAGTETGANTDTTNNSDEDNEDLTSLFGPGFTGGGAVIALFVTAGFALRRQ